MTTHRAPRDSEGPDASIGRNEARQDGCTHAQGRLFNAVADEEHGKIIGTITGDYWIDSISPGYYPENTPVVFIMATSHVDGGRGTITFSGYGAIDFSEQAGPKGAVLLFVTGGRGQWENATGHITLSGCLHLDESTDSWDYQGEVCVP